MTAAGQLRITEIFYSLQGESTRVGLPTVFVRLTGCPLRCSYCDTEYAFSGGSLVPLSAILEEVARHAPRHVCVTGGEPLAQPGCLDLLRQLANQGYAVSLETSGALSLAEVDPRVSCVMDIKTPGSGEVHENRFENLPLLQQKDQVKFVLCDREDYLWSRMQIDRFNLAAQVGEVLMSPSWQQLDPGLLADWILQDRLPVRMQIQLHKILWTDEPGR